MLLLYFRDGTIADKVHEIKSPKQSKGLKKNIILNTQTRNIATIDFEKDFNKLLHNAFYGKKLANIRTRLEIEIIRKNDNETSIKQQPKVTFSLFR